LLLAAARVNGLVRPNLAPWHISLSFESTDGHGRTLWQGTFEEFWAGPDKYKRIFATNKFNQVEYVTSAGIRRTGSPDGAPSELMTIVNQFLHPIPVDEDTIGAMDLRIGAPTIGQTKLVCVTALRPRVGIEQATDETDCIDENSPILRFQLSGSGNSRFIRNSIKRFQDCYLPQTVEGYGASSSTQKPILTAKLEKIEALGSPDDAQFTPPADAVSPPEVITLNERTTKPRLLHHPYPELDFQYPGEHRSVHMAGVVILELRIQTDGSVSNLRVVEGPQNMQQASIEAVRTWTYKPFVQDGKPVEVDTSVTLVYSLTP
jgi:TonB family protein